MAGDGMPQPVNEPRSHFSDEIDVAIPRINVGKPRIPQQIRHLSDLSYTTISDCPMLKKALHFYTRDFI